MMGGDLTLQSRAGQGSVFTITLPEVHEAEASGLDTVAAAAPAAVDGDNCLHKQIDFEPATVLVADDLEINRQLIVEALRHSPLDIVEASNGKEAISLARQGQPDIILMDIKMPEMDGHTAIAKIRTEPEVAAIPVIALTASGMKEDIERIHQSGFDDYLIRPYNHQQLLATLARHLPRARRHKGHRRHIGGESTQPRPAYLKPWHCPQAALHLLNGELKLRWEETQRKQRIPDIREFGLELAQLGRTFELTPLEQYGTDLCRHADNFQIDQITMMLGCYEKMLAVVEA
jgi:CheY-like chemotaxis protein